jgi:hypothetical protein
MIQILLRASGCALILAVLISLAGCSNSGKTSFEPTAKIKMEEIGQMLVTLQDGGGGPPSGVADLTRIEPMVPLSAADLRSGEIVYVWGAGVDKGQKKLVAYEKKTPGEGGWILLTDGSVRQISADEFKSMSKAK